MTSHLAQEIIRTWCVYCAISFAQFKHTVLLINEKLLNYVKHIVTQYYKYTNRFYNCQHQVPLLKMSNMPTVGNMTHFFFSFFFKPCVSVNVSCS